MLGVIIFNVIFLIFLSLVDFYSIKALKSGLKSKFKKWMIWAWVAPTVFIFCFMIYLMTLADSYPGGNSIKVFYIYSSVMFTVLATKAVISVFHFMDDLILLLRKGWKFIKSKFKKEESSSDGERISRGSFLTQLGIGAGAVTLGSFVHGIAKGKYDYAVSEVKLAFPELPEAFDGVRIVQISDMHLGSFLGNDAPVQPGLDLINAQNADYIFFTGDLVNSTASEAENWISHFKKLTAKRGKYSILGNHDYGYGMEKGSQEEADNLKRLKEIHGEMGFDLLLNQTTQLEIGSDSIDLIGVENWGSADRFPKLGDFKKATENTDLSKFNILLSHDPTHWEGFIMNKENVNLTLSGHTHGFQFGVGLGKYKLNLAPAAYRRWRGLYEESGKYLYVNTGFGFLGFPGRVNMPPEITVFTLNKA